MQDKLRKLSQGTGEREKLSSWGSRQLTWLRGTAPLSLMGWGGTYRGHDKDTGWLTDTQLLGQHNISLTLPGALDAPIVGASGAKG